MDDSTVKEQYETNEEIRAYINSFAISNNITVEEAFKHLMVIGYVEWKCNYEQSNPL